MSSSAKLKAILQSGRFVVAPGVFDMFSARVADRLPFEALYMTGYGVSGSYLGVADAGLVSYADMVGRARQIAEGIDKPLIADADTGFGGLLNVRHTVRGYEAAGVQAIQMEDQVMPKKCGHTQGRQVVPLDEMLKKIEVALEARRSDDMLIIARTDSRTRSDWTKRSGAARRLQRRAPTSCSSNRRRVRRNSNGSAASLPIAAHGCSPTWCPPDARRWWRAVS